MVMIIIKLFGTTALICDFSSVLADGAKLADPCGQAIHERVELVTVFGADGVTCLVDVWGADEIAESALTLVNGSLVVGGGVAWQEACDDASTEVRHASEESVAEVTHCIFL
mmetsp:Transcript_14718/g.16341  ORF Transcript_14718/g.16341 Transcript_14718/m.16341 type:complete len:112 (+) Transcript_14718:56-391(+)